MNKYLYGKSLRWWLLLLCGVLCVGCSGRQEERQAQLVHEITTTPMLYTVTANAQVIVTEKDAPNSWKRIFGERIILIPVQAHIRVGVDLSQVSQVSFKNNTVTLTLPPPTVEVESSIVSNETIASEVALLRSDFTEQEKALLAKRGREKIVRMLPEMNIVRPAQERAKRLIESMAEGLGYAAQVEMAEYTADEIVHLIPR